MTGSPLQRPSFRHALPRADALDGARLTAEIGVAFLCALTGTDLPVLENQAAYIAGWLQHIRNGSAADVIRAAADAERAADYLIGEGEDPSPSSGAIPGKQSRSHARVDALPYSLMVLFTFRAPTRSSALALINRTIFFFLFPLEDQCT